MKNTMLDVAMEGFTGPTLNAGQAEALQLLNDGANVFLTGVAGTGKTYALNAWLEGKNRMTHAVTASTGIAATHLNGCTIHSWSGCGIANKTAKTISGKWWWQQNVAPCIALADALVIDEISMLDGLTFELVAELVRIARQEKDHDNPWGSLQIVLVGDMGQLSPVEEEDRGFAFETDAWWEGGFEMVNLEQVMRQRESAFVNCLQGVRDGHLSAEGYQMLQARVGAYDPDAEDAVRLMTHNRQVDQVNDVRLAQVEGELREFTAEEWGSPRDLERLNKNCLSPKVLKLKVGARVMTTKNGAGYANGSLGYVVGYEDDDYGPPTILVRFDGRDRPWHVGQAEWKNTKMEAKDGKVKEKTIARRKQYPLRLAWAITVHKSQGMTLGKVSVDLSRVFAPGQAYVALSRASSLGGLNIEGWRGAHSIKAHPTVCSFMAGSYALPSE